MNAKRLCGSAWSKRLYEQNTDAVLKIRVMDGMSARESCVKKRKIKCNFSEVDQPVDRHAEAGNACNHLDPATTGGGSFSSDGAAWLSLQLERLAKCASQLVKKKGPNSRKNK